MAKMRRRETVPRRRRRFVIELCLKLAQRGYITQAQCAAAIGLRDLIKEAETAASVDVRLDAIQLLNKISSQLTPESTQVIAAILSGTTVRDVAETLGCAPPRLGFLAAVAFDELIEFLHGRELRAASARTMGLVTNRGAFAHEKVVLASDARKAFRASLPWRRLRFEVLAENAARHGGVATCELCSSTDGPMHVDHIECVSKNFDRRLDKSNLQVLCGDCNIGKLHGPAVDFRGKIARPRVKKLTPCLDLPLFAIPDAPRQTTISLEIS